METTDLKGKVVVVTGAGRGIGREIALLCGRRGASVVVNDYGGPSAEGGTETNPAIEVVAEIQSHGGKAVANGASIAEPSAAE